MSCSRAASGARERAARRAAALAAGDALQRARRRPARPRCAAPRRRTTISASRSRGRSSPRCTRRPAETRSTRSRSCARSSARGVSVEAGQPAAGARLAPRPRPRSPARAARREPRLPARRGGARAPDRSRSPKRRRVSRAASGSRRRSRRASSSSTASGSASRIRCSPQAPTRPPIRCVAPRSTRGSPSCSRIPKRARGSSRRRSTSPTRRSRRRSRRPRTTRAARGAPRPAALLLDRARELTPPDRARRRACAARVDAAFLHFESGDSRRAEAQLRERHRAAALPGPQRAQGARACLRASGCTRRPARRASSSPRSSTRRRATARRSRSRMKASRRAASGCSSGSTKRSSTRTSRSSSPPSSGDDALARGRAHGRALARDRCSAGRRRPRPPSGRSRSRRLRGGRRVLDQPLLSLAECWIWTDCARARPRRARRACSARRGARRRERPALAPVPARRGRACARQPRDGRSSARARGRRPPSSPGSRSSRGISLALEGLAQAQLGRAEQAGDAAERARDAGPTQVPSASSRVGRARPPRALARHAERGRRRSLRARASSSCARRGIVEPGAIRFVVDQVEALIELGRRDEAVELLDWYEGNARRLERRLGARQLRALPRPARRAGG